MQPKHILFFALILSGGLFGCSTAFHPATSRQTDMPPLYLYWGSETYNSVSRFLSARIHLDENIHVGGNDFLDLKGRIEQRGTNLVADLVGSTGQQAQFYRGNMVLEKPFYSQGGAASGGAGPPFWFLLSTNSDYRMILEHVNTARGLTNTPFNHPPLILSPPSIPHTPELIDPTTGLPPNQEKQP